MVIHCKNKFDCNEENYQEHFNVFQYDLSDFQKWSIYAIVNGHHSLVTAHTGSGKSLPAEFAIQYFKRQGKKVIYTAPIKALCNQKLHDLKLKFPHISFGILTGDIKDNPEADVLIMTTEILRNTLFTMKINETNKNEEEVKENGGKYIDLKFDMDINRELGAVVFDEVHYIGDKDRGSVWEQSILLLPPQVQLIMLSATLEKPEVFANWIETEKNKNNTGEYKKLYMTTTHERVVPLTHYAWITTNQAIVKEAKETQYEVKVKENCNKPIILADNNGNYNENNYYKIKDLISYIKKNKQLIKRKYVLNDVVKYLYRNNMLPAICFIFSRKNVEIAAKEISLSLFDKDDKTPNIIEHECEQILINKIKNYKEYTNLDEYREMITLLKKGIAIHHAGIMPVLREMVELLFEKKYIKLLFATETFAVGINMPTKTVIFTAVDKYSNNGLRYLLPHEYTQMAGRAGRRGIDTIGHVIHCNNLFDIPDNNTYKKMMTGSPKMLTSQFKFSFNLILNIISSNQGNVVDAIDKQLIEFMEQSFIKNDIIKELNNYDIINNELEEKNKKIEEELKFCKTPKEIIDKYFELIHIIDIVSNNQKKKYQKELSQLINKNNTLKNDCDKYFNLEHIKEEIERNKKYKFEAQNYIKINVDTIIKILKDQGFIDETFVTTDKAQVAIHLNEVHPLAFGDLYKKSEGFKNLSSKQLVCLFSCFTNISIPDDIKCNLIKCDDIELKTTINLISDYIDKYYDIEIKNELDTGTDYSIHYDLIYYINKWCDCDNEIECKILINQLKEDKEIFLGEFIKCILKINNITREFELIAETLNNIELLEKLKHIPVITLKYVASNQSLYI